MKQKYISSTILISLIPILTFILLIGQNKTSINNNITIITLTIILISLSIILKLYLSKKETNYNISQFITITINILLIFSIYNINKQYDYLSNTINNKYIYTKNNLLVLKNTKYHSISSLNNKTIGILSSNYNNSKNLLNYKNKKLKYKTYNSKEKMINDLKNGEIQSILLNENDINILKNKSHKILKETRSIYETKIKSNI